MGTKNLTQFQAGKIQQEKVVNYDTLLKNGTFIKQKTTFCVIHQYYVQLRKIKPH